MMSLLILISVWIIAFVVGFWVFYVLIVIWWKPRKLGRLLREQGIKGPPRKFLFGDLQEYASLTSKAQAKPMDLNHRIVQRVLPFVYQSVERDGLLSFSWLGNTPTVNVLEPELIREILFNKSGDFSKIQPDPLTKLLALGLVSYEGEKWARYKRIINPAFQFEKLKMMVPAMYASCAELVGKWEKLLSNGSCELDVWPEFLCLTGDVISRTAFGSNYEQGRQIYQLQTELAGVLISSPVSMCLPGFRFLPTERNRRMKKIYREVRTVLTDMINKRMDAIEVGEAHNKDLLGLLLESNLKHIKEQGNSKNVGMSLDDVIEECKLFFFAGQETTSSLLVWTMVLLSMHPEWQARAREEVLQVFGGAKPNFEDLHNLKVVTMILNEVLRLYPPAPLVGRMTYKEAKLGKSITIPAGVQIIMPSIMVHHDHKLWGKDAEEFNPNRFFEGVSNATKDRLSYFPFSWGPRICIGQNFAMIEAKMALAVILQHFSFELSPAYIHAPYIFTVLQPQHGAHIILHEL